MKQKRKKEGIYKTVNDACCKNCHCKRRLKHNFQVDKGFEETYCCVLFANEKDGYVIQADPTDFCEEFRKGGAEK